MRNMQGYILLAGILVLWTAASSAQAPVIEWEKTYGGDGAERVYAVDAAPGGYIIIGQTSTFGAGNSDIYILRTDTDGDSLWMKAYGTGNQERGWDIVSCSAGGYASASKHKYVLGAEEQILFYRLDENGDIAGERTYGHIGQDDVCSIIETAGGGFAIAGFTDVGNTGQTDVYLVRTDANGDTIWTRNYGGPEDDEGYHVQQTADGGFIVTGSTESFGAGGWDIYLVRTDAGGDTLWTKTYGGAEYDMGSCARVTADGGYIITGYTRSYGAGRLDAYLIKTNAGGDTIWTKTHGGYHDEYSECVREVTNGYILTGYTKSFGIVGNDIYVVRTDLLGDTLWTKVIDWGNQDWGYSILPTGDGGYIVAGYTNSKGAGSDDACLIKLGVDVTATDDPGMRPAPVPIHVRCHPNPFNPVTTVTYRLARACHVNLFVFDAAGRKIATLQSGPRTAGEHSAFWTASGCSSGIYFVCLEAPGGTGTAKVVLLK